MLKSSVVWMVIGLPWLADVARSAEKLPTGVACLLEENAAELLPKLTNPWGDPGEGAEEKEIVFAGKSAIKITTLQRYCNLIPGWAYRIAEKPKEGEFRYLRFAWKADALAGIMLQLHDDKDWHIRYTAGTNKFGWESKTVAASPPAEWSVVTIDLFKDFGEREIHGIALTMFDGTAGYFDHIYFARTIEELDAIDATGLGDSAPLKLSPKEVETHWKQLSSPDASVAYRSFWTLAAAGDSAQPVLAKKLGGEAEEVDVAQIEKWLAQLDDDDFATRELSHRAVDHAPGRRQSAVGEGDSSAAPRRKCARGSIRSSKRPSVRSPNRSDSSDKRGGFCGSSRSGQGEPEALRAGGRNRGSSGANASGSPNRQFT